MKRLLLLPFLLLFVAASLPQLLVEIDTDPVEVVSTQAIRGAPARQAYGEWELLALDEEGDFLASTQFSPYQRSLTGGQDILLEDLFVPVAAKNGVYQLVIRDQNGETLYTHILPGTCGDGLCSSGEADYCIEDCPLYRQSNEALLASRSQEPDMSWGFWSIALVCGCILLIIVLILVLFHVNRKKPSAEPASTYESDSASSLLRE